MILKFISLFTYFSICNCFFYSNINRNQNLYYYDKRIHNVGNIGFGGYIHAQLAPYTTKLIDYLRYDGNDIRDYVKVSYNTYYYKKFGYNPTVIDLCCGVGVSTSTNQIGIDTSLQMITKARNIVNFKNFYYKNKLKTKYLIGNAETYGKNNSYDCVTIMFAMHEIPEYAQNKIIQNCIRIAKKDIIIVDISPKYTPSKLMLSGEPYLINYLSNFNNIMVKNNFTSIELVKNHVNLWHYTFIK